MPYKYEAAPTSSQARSSRPATFEPSSAPESSAMASLRSEDSSLARSRWDTIQDPTVRTAGSAQSTKTVRFKDASPNTLQRRGSASSGTPSLSYSDDEYEGEALDCPATPVRKSVALPQHGSKGSCSSNSNSSTGTMTSAMVAAESTISNIEYEFYEHVANFRAQTRSDFGPHCEALKALKKELRHVHSYGSSDIRKSRQDLVSEIDKELDHLKWVRQEMYSKGQQQRESPQSRRP